jgi:hypothetical protein
MHCKQLLSATFSAILLGSTMSSSALAGQPNFSPALYGDGEVWGTKGTTELPAPNGKNNQSFDKLFIFPPGNAAAGQLPVSEAAPGNPNYNGGRWFTHTVMWNQDITPVVLESYAELMDNYQAGYLTIMPGSFTPDTPDYFQCPLLPVK